MSTSANYNPHYTVADYYQWDGDRELWNGVAIATGPSPFGPHQSLAAKIALELLARMTGVNCNGFTLLPRIDWIVDEHTVVRPDMIIVSGGVPERHVESPPVLIVEILSDSTREKDRKHKFNLYQSEGVPYYLIADPESKTLEVYRLFNGKYQRQPFDSTFPIDLSDDCKFELNPETIFE